VVAEKNQRRANDEIFMVTFPKKAVEENLKTCTAFLFSLPPFLFCCTAFFLISFLVKLLIFHIFARSFVQS
jgi:hypothetical protein